MTLELGLCRLMMLTRRAVAARISKFFLDIVWHELNATRKVGTDPAECLPRCQERGRRCERDGKVGGSTARRPIVSTPKRACNYATRCPSAVLGEAAREPQGRYASERGVSRGLSVRQSATGPKIQALTATNTFSRNATAMIHTSTTAAGTWWRFWRRSHQS